MNGQKQAFAGRKCNAAATGTSAAVYHAAPFRDIVKQGNSCFIAGYLMDERGRFYLFGRLTYKLCIAARYAVNPPGNGQ
jgi:hypothetical protein